MNPSPLPAFAGYGIELEYMIVDRGTLAVLPLADELLRKAAGSYVSEVKRGALAWSNELTLHVLELKNSGPDPSLERLCALFQVEVGHVNELLDPFGARLMPTAMHPWMNPLAETRLWPHDNAIIYQTYDRIFGCKGHGWANLQSMQLNLPFADDDQFARLHAAIRLVLPIVPALAASSPIAEGRSTGFLDARMEAYRSQQQKIPSTIGRVIPDTIASRAEYEAQVLAPIYRDIAPFDPEGVLRHEWLNVRGTIPRFDRNALEIRIIDLQECPHADLAIAAAVIAAVRAVYDAKWAPLPVQQAIATDPLVEIMLACIRDAEQAVIDDVEYLRLLGFPGRRCEARALWQHLIETTLHSSLPSRGGWEEPLCVILEHGVLARRILRALDRGCTKPRLHAVYGELCDCLEHGRMFLAVQ